MTEYIWMGSGNPLFEELQQLRQTIFHTEFGLPQNFGSADDRTCLHLLLKQDGQPAACARLARGMDTVFIATTVAVAKPFRGQGIGSAMLQELAQKSRQLGCECLRLTAELDTVSFFKKRGMIATGMECDIADYTVEIMVAYLDDNPYQISWLRPGQDISDALAVRRQVFGKELGYTNDPDDLDPIAHTMLIHQDGKVVACGRVAPLPDGRYKLGKIALSGELRGGGMGRKLVEALEFKALELGA
ncbi:MAG: GNAT family N-acetyltransferase [Oscillospiraceae bacterium]|nr:GNAT family N-acetyltransferase [Oscillospiraceae bacterium]